MARDQVLVVHAARAAAREASVDAGDDRVHDAARRKDAGEELVEGVNAQLNFGSPSSPTVESDSVGSMVVMNPGPMLVKDINNNRIENLHIFQFSS